VPEVIVEARPPWPLRLPRFAGHDRLMVIAGGVAHRLLFVGEHAVLVRAAIAHSGTVLLAGHAAERSAALEGIAAMRAALGVDQDLRPFHKRFRSDPLIGPELARDPGLRVPGRPRPFEALALAVCEQLIDALRAGAIQRRLIAALGRRCEQTGMSDAPSAQAIAGCSPVLLRSLGLAEARALALRAAAREVASGRVDLEDPEHERAWRRLAAIPGIGSWTLARLALHGQGRLDQLPAGDLAYRKLVGRVLSGGDPSARASEEQVAQMFGRYEPWSGLAGIYALRAGARWIASVSHGASASAAASSSALA
jgi:3-methyladenine DNA glycosylase/8-oxoguanine DNA glycosylase